MYGNEVYYIPRKLVSKDDILGEDRLSEFKTAFPIEMYFENVDSFAGQGAFIQKFGLMVEQSATLVVARRRWDQFIGRYGVTTVPNRPNEGDLIYFPLTKGLFEIKFVQHQDPFYQLGKLYVYKLQVELFQYASERIDTGVSVIDNFETLKSFTTNTTRTESGRIVFAAVVNGGSGYIYVPSLNIIGGGGSGAVLEAVIEDGEIVDVIIINPGNGYNSVPTITVTGSGINGIVAVTVEANIDTPDSFGDNNAFKKAAVDVIFNENNPFGEIVHNSAYFSITTADSSITRADSTTITADST